MLVCAPIRYTNDWTSFFTVYEPWWRPNMAYYKFAKAILAGTLIKVFSNGKLECDFTYISDIIEDTFRLITSADYINKIRNGTGKYMLFSIGNNTPITLMEFIKCIEETIDKERKRKPIIEMKLMRLGDVYETYADIEKINNVIGFSHKTNIHSGMRKFIG